MALRRCLTGGFLILPDGVSEKPKSPFDADSAYTSYEGGL